MPTFRYNDGHTRELSERDAKILTLLKKGEVVKAPAEVKTEAVDESPADTPKRAYKTKQLKAE